MGDIGVNMDDVISFVKSLGSSTPIDGRGHSGIEKNQEEMVLKSLEEMISVCREKPLSEVSLVHLPVCNNRASASSHGLCLIKTDSYLHSPYTVYNPARIRYGLFRET